MNHTYKAIGAGINGCGSHIVCLVRDDGRQLDVSNARYSILLRRGRIERAFDWRAAAHALTAAARTGASS